MENRNMGNDWGSVFTDILSNGVDQASLDKLKMAIDDSVVESLADAGKTVKDALRDAANCSTQAMKESYKTTTGRKPYSNREETEAYARMLQQRRQAHNEQVAYEERMRRARKMVEGTNVKVKYKDGSLVSLDGRILPTKFEPIGKSSGMACIVSGTVLAMISGASLLTKIITVAFGGAAWGTMILPGMFLLLAIGLISSGTGKRKLLDRARRYAQICGEKMYGDIKAISSSMGLKSGKVKKDIKKMLRMGFFPEGYLDANETTLMLSESVYSEYQKSVLSSITASAGAVANDLGETPVLNETEAIKQLSPEQKEELVNMIKDGNAYISKLHKLNDDIPGELITLKLSKLEEILKAIFKSVEAHPEQMGRMHKLMDYYLPTMIKLVETYAEYDKVSNPGPDIISAKEQINVTLDTINEAFIQLQNNLFQDSVWDVTSDAEVLTTMLKQEGLVSDI